MGQKDITELYRVERQARPRAEAGTSRPVSIRQAKPAPLFGKLREAVSYANRRWRNLARYAKLDHGHSRTTSRSWSDRRRAIDQDEGDDS
jgi:hypothetical protein